MQKTPVFPSMDEWHKAIGKVPANRRGLDEISDMLEGVRQANAAQRVISTFTADEATFEKIINDACTAGTHVVTHANFSLKSTGEEASALEFHAPAAGALAFTTLLYISSNVHNNFYVHLKRADGSPVASIRLTNKTLSLCGHDLTTELREKKPQLLTLAVDKQFVSVFINGQVRWKKGLKVAELPAYASMELLPKRGGALQAHALGAALWSVGESLAFSKDRAAAIRAEFDDALEEGDVMKVFSMMRSHEDLAMDARADRILGVMQEELTKKTSGPRFFILNELQKTLPEAQAQQWADFLAENRPKPLISISDISVEFYRNPADRFSLKHMFNKSLRERISIFNSLGFDIYPGDVVGVIGPNGVGKSTLLKAIAGMVPISTGSITITGQYMLLRAGVGIRPHLTGRENIYHAGVYLGLWGKELERVVEEVSEFCELGKDLDKPLRYYSDGMKSRLIFSLATSIKPGILMLDELLGAGDISFKDKAAKRLEQFMGGAKAVIIVTHGLNYVRSNCNKALYLSKAGKCYFGDPETAVQRYLDEVDLVGVGGADIAEAMEDYDETMMGEYL